MADDEKRMELTEHLAELRTRILRIIAYVVVGSILAFLFFDRIYAFIEAPMMKAIKASGVKVEFVFLHFTQAFFTVLQMSVVAGLILTSPLVTAELWGFISPALTREEKKPLRWLAPFSVLLSAAGVALGYWVSSYAIYWFLGYVRFFGHVSALYQDPRQFALFMIKMMAAFGIVFQLPVVLMFLAWVGILSSDVMKKSWRHAIVLISVVGLFVTPSNDAFTMLMMIIPVIILYLGSIWLVRLVERAKARQKRAGKSD